MFPQTMVQNEKKVAISRMQTVVETCRLAERLVRETLLGPLAVAELLST